MKFYVREVKSMRRLRRTTPRPPHLSVFQWRFLEWRFAWILARNLLLTR